MDGMQHVALSPAESVPPPAEVDLPKGDLTAACVAAASVLGIALHLQGMRTELLRRRVRTLTILEAERLDAPPLTAPQAA